MSGRLVLILTIVVLIGGVLALRWFQRTPPQQVAASVRKTLLVSAGILLISLAATGRLHWLFALAGGALAFAQRLFGMWRMFNLFKSFSPRQSQPSSGQQSRLDTRYLKMVLDHDSGEMHGSVQEGQFSGQQLKDMSETDCLALYNECCAADQQSAAVLAAYMDRRFGAQWRASAEVDPDASAQIQPTDMSRLEALQILGLEDGANQEEIANAHRRLIQKLHPDRGGSTFLAAKINKAKDLLLQNGS